MSTIKIAKMAMNFQSATQRPACNNCAHAEERVCIAPTWWCGKGDFLTSALAVCAHHQRRQEVKS